MIWTTRIWILLVLVLFSQPVRAEWTRQPSGTLAWLRSVFFSSEMTGWAVGSNGTYLTTHDGGKTWRKSENLTNDNILDIYFSDDLNGWLLCERDPFRIDDSPTSYLMRTADGGLNWEKVELQSGRERLVRFAFNKFGGVAFGESGVIWRMENVDRTWRRSNLPTKYLILGGVFERDGHGVLVGGSGTVLFTDDWGISWSRKKLPEPGSVKLHAAAFSNSGNAWLVGAEGKIYKSKNYGNSWLEQTSTISEDLNDVFFLDDFLGFAVGGNGTILRTTTGGETWAVEKNRSKYKLERVYFKGNRGYAVGFGGTILSIDIER